jgi:hypothetical protein
MTIQVLDGLVAKGDVGNAAIEATVKERARSWFGFRVANSERSRLTPQ